MAQFERSRRCNFGRLSWAKKLAAFTSVSSPFRRTNDATPLDWGPWDWRLIRRVQNP